MDIGYSKSKKKKKKKKKCPNIHVSLHEKMISDPKSFETLDICAGANIANTTAGTGAIKNSNIKEDLEMIRNTIKKKVKEKFQWEIEIHITKFNDLKKKIEKLKLENEELKFRGRKIPGGIDYQELLDN